MQAPCRARQSDTITTIWEQFARLRTRNKLDRRIRIGGNMLTKKSFLLGAAIPLAAVAVGALAEPGITADKIIIGQAAGFTGSVAGTVKELTAGAKIYFDAVNAKGGIHGRKI